MDAFCTGDFDASVLYLEQEARAMALMVNKNEVPQDINDWYKDNISCKT